MRGSQGWAMVLLIVLLLLGIARSPNVQNFFKTAFSTISGNLESNAQGQAAINSSPLDWHLFLYWFAAALLVVFLSGVAPRVTTALLGLIIMEELLTHWNIYAAYLQPPTK